MSISSDRELEASAKCLPNQSWCLFYERDRDSRFQSCQRKQDNANSCVYTCTYMCLSRQVYSRFDDCHFSYINLLFALPCECAWASCFYAQENSSIANAKRISQRTQYCINLLTKIMRINVVKATTKY